MLNYDEDIFEKACAIYGECIGMSYCLDTTAERLMYEEGLDEEDALEYAKLAYAEWVEAYE